MSEELDIMDTMKGVTEATSNTISRPDYAMFRSGAKEHFSEIFEYENFPELMLDMIRKTILLPRADTQLPILAAYLSIPTGLATKIPVLFSHGPSGCGKSVVASIASAVYKSDKLGAASTMAGLRNQIQFDKFSGGRERHYALIWDDINPGMLSANNASIFSLIKNGVERDAKFTMAGGEAGENISFDIFCSKITSSVHSIFALYEFRELVRRCIVIQHKPIQHWVKSDYSTIYDGITADDLIDVDDLNITDVHNEFESFWDTGKLMDYQRVKNGLKNFRKIDCPRPLWNMSKDLLTTGVVCGYWKDVRQGIDAICAYWQWHSENVESQVSNLQKVLKRFVEESSAETEKRNDMLRTAGMLSAITNVEIDPKELKAYFNQALANGEIEPGTQHRQVNDAMLQIGFKLNQNSAGKSAWMRITD